MKIGTIGTGFIVDTFLDAVKQNEGVEVVAMYSRRKESAMPLASKYGVDTIYTNLDDLYNDERIEFIYVASPNSLHYEQTLNALQAGKHVLCEKPFTSTVKELEHLIRIAKERQLFLFEAITTIHLPNYQKMKEYIKDLGPIKVVQCNFSQYSSRYDALLEGTIANVFNPEFSGGALVDINLYNIHFVMNCFGKPKQVKYFANKHPNGIDTSGIAILQYDDFIVECVGAKDTRSKNIAQIQGEKGYLCVESTSGCHEVEVHIGELNETFNLQTTKNNLYYEVGVFRDLYASNDLTTCYSLLDYSFSVLETIVALRKDAGIVFSKDEETI